MKSCEYRVSDVVFMDREARDRVIAFVKNGLHLLDFSLDPMLAGIQPKLEWVGSYTFGNATLRSDADFNLAFPDWNMQVAARRLYYVPAFRAQFCEYLHSFESEFGLRIDVGCVDAETDKYNIYLDCETMLLHRRWNRDINPYNPGSISQLVYDPEARPPLDINAFNVDVDEAPPIHNIHLRLDNYAFRWMPHVNDFKQKPSEWLFDEWSENVERWEVIYGQRYTGYSIVGDKLIELR